jgi:transketolase
MECDATSKLGCKCVLDIHHEGEHDAKCEHPKWSDNDRMILSVGAYEMLQAY